jgi:hypothetical protein
MGELIATVLFLFVVGGAILRVAQWLGFVEKDQPEPGERGTMERSKFWRDTFKSLVVIIISIYVFFVYVLPRINPP